MLILFYGLLFSGFVLLVGARIAPPAPIRRLYRSRSTQHWNRHINQSLHTDNSSGLAKRDEGKHVLMHVILGNTYPYTVADWKSDFQMMQSRGIDAVALNLGKDPWQANQIQNAYDAALGTPLKIFLSFDFTEMSCELQPIVNRVNQYANHANQFKVNGKVFISSFSGDCLGNAGWASLKAQTNGYIMPFIWGLEGSFNLWNSLDLWLCWGCAWPQSNNPKTTDDDLFYLNLLGSRYATSISGWMFTHFNYKNFYLRGDDWLIVNRWEQLVAMRDRLTFVEMETWNDYGESDYFGPIKGAQPSGTTWANNFPHTAWLELSAYYITAFKTGSYPPITQDTIYFWARPHPAGAIASGDSLGKPNGWDWTSDTMWAAVFATGPATVVLTCGGSSQSFNVVAGVNKLRLPLSPGKMTVQMIRSGQTIINYTPVDYTYVTNPVLYNYNAWVGSVCATTLVTTTTPTTPTPTTTTSTTTSPTTAATPTPTNGYSYLHCYQDDGSRILSQSSSVNSGQTVTTCLAKCASGGFTYAAMEYGSECYCANTLRANALQAPENECSMSCPGNSAQKCGGSWRASVYKSGGPLWNSYGCIAEGTTGSRRALTGVSFRQTNMTPQICQSLCGGFRYAGVEYGVECYCGNTLTNNGATGSLIDSNQCNMNCGGDSSKKCGGSWTMNVYSVSP